MVLVFTAFVGAVVALYFCTGSLSGSFSMDSIAILIRGFFHCVILAFFQVMLLIRVGETKCFGVILLLAVGYTFLKLSYSPLDSSAFLYRFALGGIIYSLLCFLEITALKKYIWRTGLTMRIDVTNLSKIIRGSVILDNISIHFESGHIYGIIGKNGSGKTMLLRAISGLIVPSSGVVYVDGKALGTEISFPPEIGILIEKPEFLGHLSGFENLKMLSEIKGSISDANIAEYMNYFDLDPEEKSLSANTHRE